MSNINIVDICTYDDLKKAINRCDRHHNYREWWALVWAYANIHWRRCHDNIEDLYGQRLTDQEKKLLQDIYWDRFAKYNQPKGEVR